MDRNQIVGITLIAGIMLFYFWFMSNEQPVADEAITEKDVTTEQGEVTREPIEDSSPEANTTDSVANQQLQQRFGAFAGFAQGTEQMVEVENADIRVSFNTRGGEIRRVMLRHYDTDAGAPVNLITPETSDMEWVLSTTDGEIDLTELYYDEEISSTGDTTVITFTASSAAGNEISHIYYLPPDGYQVLYDLRVRGFSQVSSTTPVVFRWNDDLPKVEYDLEQSRLKSAITYYTEEDGFDDLGDNSEDTESETIEDALQWVAFKQKFFNVGLIADQNFQKANIRISYNVQDTTSVNSASAELFIPANNVKDNTANFKFYFGPNHYQTLKSVTEGYEKNVYLGWPVINLITRFVVIPTFNFFDGVMGDFDGRYGIIILILALLVKLILLPLSYKSYISMAKMKALKPELDKIKERVGDDMQKQQAEQMQLYQKVGVNPLSGCIPVLLSMPVLLAMFSFFPNSIELRQESFLWAHDLSTYDAPITFPFSIPFMGSHLSLFTLLMTASTVAFTFYNNQVSTVQGPMKMVSYLMPVIFLFVLNNFPAGLTFYYFVSNIFSIIQQLTIKSFVNDEKIRAKLEENRRKIAKAPKGDKKGKGSFMQRVQEAMKAQEEARKRGGK